MMNIAGLVQNSIIAAIVIELAEYYLLLPQEIQLELFLSRALKAPIVLLGAVAMITKESQQTLHGRLLQQLIKLALLVSVTHMAL
jgi:hypothetical protein